MKFEKFYNSKIFAFFEMLYRLIIVNMVTILFIILGLGIFSFMPAIIAMIIIVKSFSHETDFPLVNTFVRAFVQNYKRVMKLSLFYLVVGILFIFNTYFFYAAMVEWQGLVNSIIFNITLIIDGILILSFINACYIYVYFPHLNNKKIIKYSFILLRAIPIQAIIIILMLIGSVFLFLISPVFIIILISLNCFIINIMINKKYQKLVPDGVISLGASNYGKKFKRIDF